MTSDEQRALAFLAGLLLLSAAVRIAALPDPVDAPGGGFDLAAHVEATERAVETAERRRRPLADGETVDPNTAPVEELVRLPGVGPALARRIVEDRDRNGRYRTPSDLVRVAGVGERTAERLAPLLKLGPGVGVGVGAGAGVTARAAVSAGGRVAGGRVGAGVPGRRGSVGAEAGAGGGTRVDINRADAEALARLSGIGPVLAGRIVAWRDSVGPFESPDGLLAVRGIGPATLERIRERVAVYP